MQIINICLRILIKFSINFEIWIEFGRRYAASAAAVPVKFDYTQ